MKKAILFFLFFTLLILNFNCRKADKVGFLLEKNCTGTYFKIDGKYYKVCNPELVSRYNTGDLVNISYVFLRGCSGSGDQPSTCLLNFPFELWMQVVQVK
jgi:hypothetical protein